MFRARRASGKLRLHQSKRSEHQIDQRIFSYCSISSCALLPGSWTACLTLLDRLPAAPATSGGLIVCLRIRITSRSKALNAANTSSLRRARHARKLCRYAIRDKKFTTKHDCTWADFLGSSDTIHTRYQVFKVWHCQWQCMRVRAFCARCYKAETISPGVPAASSPVGVASSMSVMSHTLHILSCILTCCTGSIAFIGHQTRSLPHSNSTQFRKSASGTVS